MVTNVNVTLDDTTAEDIRAVKDYHGYTWAELLQEGARCLDELDADEIHPDEPAEELTEFRERTDAPGSMPSAADVDALREALPGGGPDLAGRVVAVLSMYDHLRSHGKAEKHDLLEVVDVDATGYASPDSLWANAVKASGDRPNALTLLPGVSLEGDTYSYSEP